MNQEINGRALPQGAAELASRARQSGKTEISFARDKILLALTMSKAEGEQLWGGCRDASDDLSSAVPKSGGV